MKKVFTLVLCALTAGSLFAQQHVMKIHHANGTVQTIKVAELDKITFEEATEEPTKPDDPIKPNPDDPTKPENPEVPTGDDRMVDLGLSVKWAAWNVGATKPSGYGNFYAYGEIEPKFEYTIDNYQWIWEDYEEGQFYEPWEQYLKLGESISGTNYDVAHVKWGEQWRMPTRAEWTELFNGCTKTWTAVDGVAGCLFTSKTTGNSVFFPAAGNMVDEKHTHDQLAFFFWTSNENDDFEEVCNYLANFDATYASAEGYDYPEVGFSVRAVYGPVPFTQPKYIAPTEPVDLGLSVKWAPFNVGGSMSSPAGEYFCWGETAPKVYTHRYNYIHYDPIEDTYADLGENICGGEYDPATQCWNEDWRLPTAEEFQELIEKCTWTRSGYDAVITGPNGNSIKLPAMQFMGYAGPPSGFLSPISSGYYLTGDTGDDKWASGRPTEGEVCTILKFFMAEGKYAIDGTTYRGMGMSVRPVYAK